MASPPQSYSLHDTAFFPMMPDEFTRYKRDRTAQSDQPLIIPAGMQNFAKPHPPQGWIARVHPDGAQYFINDEKMIMTDENIHSLGSYKIVMHFANAIENYRITNNISLTETTSIVFDPVKIRTSHHRKPKPHFLSYRCGYYLVEHKERKVFWLEGFPLPPLSGGGIKGIQKLWDIEHYMTAQYWTHCNHFPDPNHITERDLYDLKDRITHSIGDSIMSTTSTIPHTLQQLESSLKLVEDALTDFRVVKIRVGSAATMSRMKEQFAYHEFLNYYGQHWARLDRFQSVHGNISKRTVLLQSLSPFLFFMPDDLKKSLDDLFVDDLVSSQHYTAFVERMSAEWREIALYGTVVLNVNVAFLAISSIDAATGSDGSRSLLQISSYVSAIASIGSIMLGLALIRRTRLHGKETAFQMGEFLMAHNHEVFGFELLATIYSLPNALFTWGMIAFIIAFSSLCFQSTNSLTRIPTAIVGAVICVLFGSIWVLI
ncbi:hypothetical protein C8J57DRAFT_760959 [Mycena rebaudengoi]|nr:hypothetical protein C8J57DRAFT_760959 [Mycena rebaudengoi]